MKRLRWGFWARIGAVLVALFAVYQLWIFGHIWYWVNHNPATSAFMEDRLRLLQDQNPDAELRHRWVPYQRISVNLQRAVIAAEDYKFLDHEGFDWEGIQDAVERNLRKGRIVAGGSTISQQLAKNLFLSSRRTPWRKAEEAVITLMLETMMTKRRILEIYLNVIEWGNGVFGAAAASRYYFRTNVSALSPDQAARLAAIVPNPRYYDTHRSDARLQRRMRWILWRMRYARVP
jgi:monofunctional biosynthetic peptidoglycan transglycosylase